MSKREKNLSLIQQVYMAFGRGDTAAIINILTDDINWQCFGPARVPFAGLYHGKREVEQFFARLSQSVEVHKFEPREFIADDNNVVVIGFEEMTVRATGRIFENHWVQVFAFRDDEICHFREFSDTDAVAGAFPSGALPDGVIH